MTNREYRNLERILKGVANHRRIAILELVDANPELSVDDIASKLRIGYENTSDHTRKLAASGLIMKRNDGNAVRHKLTERGKSLLNFCIKIL